MRMDQQQIQKKGSGSDLRAKIDRQQMLSGPPSVGQRSHGAAIPTGGPTSLAPAKLDKPAGYDERRRQREMGRRTAAYDPAAPGIGERGASRGSGGNPDQYHHNEHDKRTVIRSKMYSDKMMSGGGGGNSNNNKNKPYEYSGGGGSNRGKRMSRSPPQSYINDNNEYNRHSSRDSMDRGGGINRRGRQDLKRPLSNERDMSNKRRKQRRDSSGERGPGSNQGGSVGNLKELEFRARALQSLLSKKEKSNEAYTRRGDKR